MNKSKNMIATLIMINGKPAYLLLYTNVKRFGFTLQYKLRQILLIFLKILSFPKQTNTHCHPCGSGDPGR
jgi:hypothetical protein